MSALNERTEEPRAAVLTVDDDPAVSRAVARDLRRRYGDRYRIVRAESPADGLDARRVLLTAYADTGAAIDAINVVDLDHYLLKPWDPPEEKLYPVVDALLDA